MKEHSLAPVWASLLTLGVCSLAAVRAGADTVALHPAADATLFEVAPDNSAGGAGFFNAGTTQNRTRNRALLQFDLASSLPAGAVITSAGLDLEVVRSPKDGFDVSVFGLHRVLQSWGEGSAVPTDNGGGHGAPAAPGDATWNARFAFTAQTWAAPGGLADTDFRSDFSSSTFIYGVGIYQFESTVDLVRDVQFWLDSPQSNFGWMLTAESEDLPFTARRFASREDPGGGPTLTVEFTVVPEPAPALLFASGVLGLLLTRCRPRRKIGSAPETGRSESPACSGGPRAGLLAAFRAR